MDIGWFNYLYLIEVQKSKGAKSSFRLKHILCGQLNISIHIIPGIVFLTNETEVNEKQTNW